VYLKHPLFRDRIREWLKTLRKYNGCVLLATQNLSDIFNSPIRDVVLESCPTKILLPNAEAANPASRQFYDLIGLNEREIDIIQKSLPKRQYYVVSPAGRRLIALGLGKVALSFVGVKAPFSTSCVSWLNRQTAACWRYRFQTRLPMNR